MLRRIIVRVAAATLALTGVMQFGSAQAARADASGHASCMGIEASTISPPGSSDEIPGGAAELAAEVKEIAAQLGVSPGAVFSFIASLHEGSHEACDEVLG
jgi:hypothetical protein